MEYTENTVICNCKHVTLADIDDALQRNARFSDVEKEFAEVQRLTSCSTGCGGEAHSKKEFKDISAESPEAYVRAEGRWPILDSGKNASGDVVITTGDGKGNMVRYTFTE